MKHHPAGTSLYMNRSVLKSMVRHVEALALGNGVDAPGDVDAALAWSFATSAPTLVDMVIE